MTPAIRVESLGKCFRVDHLGQQHGRYKTLRESLGSMAKAPLRRLRGVFDTSTTRSAGVSREEFWALKDVSFDVQPGEVVGIIGRNGAGKSTLLKILSRITKPTTGRVELRGRVGSLLEVGTGFHPELTGRENIYLNGSILGMQRAEIDKHFDAIVDFSGVERFLDTPAKRFSSGMYVRLAFAVAAHLDPEILMIDEVLSVGDAEFQRKCLAKMSEVARSGRTIMFVSHNMAAVQNLCGRAIVMSGGAVAVDTDVGEALARYSSLTSTTSADGELDLRHHAARRGGCRRLLQHVRLVGHDGAPTSTFAAGSPMRIELAMDFGPAIISPQVGIGFDDAFGTRVFSVATYLSNCVLPPLNKPSVLRCTIGSLPLVPGRYTLSLSAGSQGETLMDAIDNAVGFDVAAADFFQNGHLPSRSLGTTLVRSFWERV